MVQQPDVTKLMSSWLEQQQKLWQDWMNTVQQAGGGAGGLQPWTGALQGWKQAVEERDRGTYDWTLDRPIGTAD